MASFFVAALWCSVLYGADSMGRSPMEDATTVAVDNSFAIDLYTNLLKTDKGNAFFSPYSIRTILTMTFAGAGGKTAAQMASVLHLDSVPPAQLHSAFAALSKTLNAKDADFDLTVANALWGQMGYGFRKNFQDLLQTNYGASLHEMDFAHSAEAARLTINKWVEQKTNEKIKDLLAKGAVDDLTCLVLTDAIYFKGVWKEPFQKEQTRQETFHLDVNQDVQAPMMHHGTSSLKYFGTDQFQAAELPYKGGEISMVLIVPRAIDGLSAVEKEFTSESIAQWPAKMENQRVILTMPKFTMTRALDLNVVLKGMGMVDAFDRHAADFSGMVTAKQMEIGRPYISQVIHKAFVDVDEAGMEAAAATAVVMMAGSAIMKPMAPPIVVTADRPFLFLIRHRDSGVILFLGQLVDPRG